MTEAWPSLFTTSLITLYCLSSLPSALAVTHWQPPEEGDDCCAHLPTLPHTYLTHTCTTHNTHTYLTHICMTYTYTHTQTCRGVYDYFLLWQALNEEDKWIKNTFLRKIWRWPNSICAVFCPREFWIIFAENKILENNLTSSKSSSLSDDLIRIKIHRSDNKMILMNL